VSRRSVRKIVKSVMIAMEHLSSEVLQSILRWLPGESVATLSCTSRAMWHTLKTDSVWQQVYFRRWHCGSVCPDQLQLDCAPTGNDGDAHAPEHIHSWAVHRRQRQSTVINNLIV
jgi:hypothetical protein